MYVYVWVRVSVCVCVWMYMLVTCSSLEAAASLLSLPPDMCVRAFACVCVCVCVSVLFYDLVRRCWCLVESTWRDDWPCAHKSTHTRTYTPIHKCTHPYTHVCTHMHAHTGNHAHKRSPTSSQTWTHGRGAPFPFVAAAAVSGLLFAFGSFMSAKRDSTGGGGGVRMICMDF